MSRADELFEIIGDIDDAFVLEAAGEPMRKAPRRRHAGFAVAVAACLCLVAAGIFALNLPGESAVHSYAQPLSLNASDKPVAATSASASMEADDPAGEEGEEAPDDSHASGADAGEASGGADWEAPADPYAIAGWFFGEGYETGYSFCDSVTIFEDDEYEYMMASNVAHYLTVAYENGDTENAVEALHAGRVTINDLLDYQESQKNDGPLSAGVPVIVAPMKK